jgi:hypothetical protein
MELILLSGVSTLGLLIDAPGVVSITSYETFVDQTSGAAD